VAALIGTIFCADAEAEVTARRSATREQRKRRDRVREHLIGGEYG
jgi:hypothetical protein